MIFSGLEQMGEIPFDTVFIHGLVRDSLGRKMSKSLGNGVDPIEIIDKYGTDALRFSLILGISPGNDIRYMPEKLEAASNFANKLWNASKFVLMNLEDYNKENVNLSNLRYEDKWILSKLNRLSKEVTNNMENYEIGVATQKVYDFIWNEFCDWYIEIVKTRLYDKDNSSRSEAQYTLNKILKDVLKLLHPIMPFVTEEIYLKLYDIDESIMISDWPKYSEEFDFEKEEKQIEKIKEIIVGIRNLRTKFNVHPSKKPNLIFVTDKFKEVVENLKDSIKKLAFGNEIIIQENKEGIDKNAISVLIDGIEVYIPFNELIDVEAEKERLIEEKKKVEAEITRADKMLNNQGFISKAPQAKIDEEKEKLDKYKKMLDSINKRLIELV